MYGESERDDLIKRMEEYIKFLELHPEEAKAFLIRCGINNPDGSLTAQYGGGDMPRKLRNVRKYSFEEIKDSEELMDQEFVLAIDFEETLDDIQDEVRDIISEDEEGVYVRLVKLADKLY